MGQLNELDLIFDRCTQLADITQLLLGLKWLRQLEQLSMSFWGCMQLQSVSGLEIALPNLKRLEAFSLRVRNCDSLKDLDSLSGRTCCTALTSFELICKYCDALTHISSLGEGLQTLKQLQSLTLCCDGCAALADVNSLTQAVKELPQLQHLELSMLFCNSLPIAMQQHFLAEDEFLHACEEDWQRNAAWKVMLQPVKNVSSDCVTHLRSLRWHVALTSNADVKVKSISDGVSQLKSLRFLDLNLENFRQLLELDGFGRGLRTLVSFASKA